jgi:hypothetical protein
MRSQSYLGPFPFRRILRLNKKSDFYERRLFGVLKSGPKCSGNHLQKNQREQSIFCETPVIGPKMSFIMIKHDEKNIPDSINTKREKKERIQPVSNPVSPGKKCPVHNSIFYIVDIIFQMAFRNHQSAKGNKFHNSGPNG